MIIGLVDLDLQSSSSTSFLVPNIEIMKLATYYKIEENRFCRLLSLEDQDLSSYEKVYVFSEQPRAPIVPETFRRASNVIYGGTAFTNGTYIPFDNSIIDFTIPRPDIYAEFLKEKIQDGVKIKVIEHVLDDSYYRNYAGEERLPLPAVLPRKRMLLYDKEFFYPDWKKTIERISDRNPSGIFRVHPIVCNTLTQFFDVRSYQRIARSNEIILDINIPLSDVNHMMHKYEKYFLAEINKSSNIYLPIGGNFSTSQQYMRDFVYKINLLYSFWACNIPMKLYYIAPQIGYVNPLINLEEMISTWSCGDSKHSKTINDRIPKDKKRSEVRPARAERDKLLEFIPEAKELFFRTYDELVAKRRWAI